MSRRTSLPFLALSSLLLATAAGCASSSDGTVAEQANALGANSVLERLERARGLDSEAGSAVSESEAYELAFELCPSTSCVPLDAPLVAALDDVAVNTRVTIGAWDHFHESVVRALQLTTTSTPPTVESWPTERPNTHSMSVPFFALGIVDDPQSPSKSFLTELAAHDGAVVGQSAKGLFDASGKVVAFHVDVVLNPCNGCADELHITIGVDGTVLEKSFRQDSSYCC